MQRSPARQIQHPEIPKYRHAEVPIYRSAAHYCSTRGSARSRNTDIPHDRTTASHAPSGPRRRKTPRAANSAFLQYLDTEVSQYRTRAVA